MSSNLLSPGVSFKETDLTTYTEGVATSIGAFAGTFSWGPVMDVTQVSNEEQLVSRFGKPNNTTYQSFFSSKNFLDYSNNLKVVRLDVDGQKNSVSTGTAVKINNEADYIASYSNGEASVGMFAAKYPGTIGNSLKVSLCDASTFSKTLTGTVAVTSGSATIVGTGTAFTDELAVGSFVELTVSGTKYTKQVTAIADATHATVDSTFSVSGTATAATVKWEYASLFAAAPYDSNQALSFGATKDGMHMVVVDEDGLFSGAKGTVLETYDNVFKSRDSLRFDGTSGYYKNVLNSSKYVWWMDHPDTAEVTTNDLAFGAACASGVFAVLKKPITRSLVSGADGTAAATDGETQLGFDLFKNTETQDVQCIFTGAVSAVVSSYVIQSVAEYRADCVAFVSPTLSNSNSPIIGDTSDTLEKIIAARNAIGVSSSYGVMDSGFKYQYDKYNDVYRWIALNADIAGLCARTDSVAETWYSPAGLNRGQIKNVVKLSFNPDKPSRDELFKANVNPVVMFAGEGTVLFGDKTLQARPSAFDAINVRRLFIYLEKSIANASKYFLFEQNTDLTRQLFVSTLTPILRDAKGRQGITDYYIDVGNTVNTADTIDAGELRCNIFIKPVRSVRFIQLQFIATKTGAVFTEIEL